MPLFLDAELGDSLLVDQTRIEILEKYGRRVKLKVVAENDVSIMLQQGIKKKQKSDNSS